MLRSPASRCRLADRVLWQEAPRWRGDGNSRGGLSIRLRPIRRRGKHTYEEGTPMAQQLFAHRPRVTADLNRLVRGPVHRPGDEDYDAQRASLNPTFDARPAVITEATCS